MLILSVKRDTKLLTRSEQPVKHRRTRTSYTLNVFINEAQKIHGSNYDYGEVTEIHINDGIQSRIPIKCNQCENKWTTSIKVHINSKSKCPICARSWRWTLGSFVSAAKEIHGERYDYSHITSEHINGKDSHVPILCKKCDKIWTPTIASHINNKSDCASCPIPKKWTLQKFLVKANHVHSDKYNYSLITNEMVDGAFSYLPIICNKCNSKWDVTVNNHINHGCGCPRCKLSKGELACESTLKDLGIDYISQAKIVSLPSRKYDFSFIHNEIRYLLEFDGLQHFEYGSYFHKTAEKFVEKQDVDYIKTQKALDEGYKVIRISYLNFHDIKYHIRTALDTNRDLYLSDPEMYKYITSRLIVPRKYLTLNIQK